MASRLSDRLLASGLVPTAGVRGGSSAPGGLRGRARHRVARARRARRGDALGRPRRGDGARRPGPRTLRGAAKAGQAGRLGRARPRRRLVGALPRGAGRAEGRGAADPLRRAGGARGDRGRGRRARHSVRAGRGAGDLDRGRAAGDLRPGDGAAAGAPVRAGRGGAAGAALAGGAHAGFGAGAARAAHRGSAPRLPPPAPLPARAEPISPSATPSVSPPRQDKAEVPALIEGSNGDATSRPRTPRWSRSASRTSDRSRGGGRPGGSCTRLTTGWTGCSRGCRTRRPRSGPPPSRSCAR